MERYEIITAFFDTTVFRQDPLRRKPEFGLIEKLAELDRFKLHLSEITWHEFVTQQELQFDEQVQKVESAVSDIRKRLKDAKLLAILEGEIAALKMKRKVFSEEFSGWLSSLQADVHQIADHHGRAVIKKYFQGIPPFRRIKERKDFPDAFVFEALTDLVKEHQVLHVVTADKQLAKAARDFKKVEVYETVREFVRGASLDTFLHRTINLEAIIARIEDDADAEKEYLIEPILNELAKTPGSPMSEEYDFIITGTGSLDEFHVDGQSAEDYGDGMFIIPFSASSECLTEYCMPKWEWHGQDESKDRGSIEEWNDYVYRVEQYKYLRISGTLGFQVDLGTLETADADKSDIAFAAENAAITIEIDEVSVPDDEC